MNDNPYSSPSNSDQGNYDWSLALRLLQIAAAIAFFYLLLVAIPLWKQFTNLELHREQSELKKLVDFATNWRGDR